jgi:predicted nuclease of restriction endonuclease-like (RecB) superfamily
MSDPNELSFSGDFASIAQLIRERRTRALQAVNHELVTLYWEVGKMLSAKTEAENWGQKTIGALSTYLKSENPGLKGFSRRGLYRMKQFYETYPGEIVPTLLTQLSWSHNLLIFSQCKLPDERDFYLQASIKEQWSFLELTEKGIDDA